MRSTDDSKKPRTQAKLAWDRAYQKRRYDSRKLAMRLAKDKPCADCGVKYHHAVMEFDHIGEKNFVISRTNKSIEDMMEEISRCEVVCSNCHAIRTWNRKHPEEQI